MLNRYYFEHFFVVFSVKVKSLLAFRWHAILGLEISIDRNIETTSDTCSAVWQPLLFVISETKRIEVKKYFC